MLSKKIMRGVVSLFVGCSVLLLTACSCCGERLCCEEPCCTPLCKGVVTEQSPCACGNRVVHYQGK